MRGAIPLLAALALAGCGREDLEVGWARADGRSLDLVYTIEQGPELGEVDVVEEDDPLGSRPVIDGATGRPPEPHPPDDPVPEGVPCEPE